MSMDEEELREWLKCDNKTTKRSDITAVYGLPKSKKEVKLIMKTLGFQGTKQETKKESKFILNFIYEQIEEGSKINMFYLNNKHPDSEGKFVIDWEYNIEEFDVMAKEQGIEVSKVRFETLENLKSELKDD